MMFTVVVSCDLLFVVSKAETESGGSGHVCGTYHFVCKGIYIVGMRKGAKTTEGRKLGHSAFKKRGLPCASCCVHVHNYSIGVFCKLVRAPRVCAPEDTITDDNFKRYVPHAGTRAEAIDEYYGGPEMWANSKTKIRYVWMDLMDVEQRDSRRKRNRR